MKIHLHDDLLAPISPELPGGEDLTYAPELDLIRAARKGDDSSLSQGDWVRELRAPEWGKVREVAEDVLCRRSKHLQVAAWYGEALAHLEGFAGVGSGLRLMRAFMEEFWDTCHPLPEGGDLDERAGRVEWFGAQLAGIVRGLPLLRRDAGGYGWRHWDEARTTENLGKRDPGLREAALAEGKLTMEAFQRAVTQTGVGPLEVLEGQVREAQAECRLFIEAVDRRFGVQGPPMEELQRALDGVADLLGVLLRPHRLPGVVPLVAEEPLLAGHDFPTMHLEPVGPVRSRQEAVKRLREVAAYFREKEPHSPVAHLVERAAKWAEMPLDRWLASVVKDAGTLGELKELLGME